MEEPKDLKEVFEDGLANGYKHYRESDGKLLATVTDILLTLQKEGGITVIKPNQTVKQYAMQHGYSSEYVPVIRSYRGRKYEPSMTGMLDSDIATQYRPEEGTESKN